MSNDDSDSNKDKEQFLLDLEEALEQDLNDENYSFSHVSGSKVQVDGYNKDAYYDYDYGYEEVPDPLFDDLKELDFFDLDFSLDFKSKKAKKASVAKEKEAKGQDSWYDDFLELYIKDMELMITKSMKSKKKLTSYHVIKGSGDAWYFEPLSKTFIKIQRGSEVIVVPNSVDEQGRVLVRTLNGFLMVPEDEIVSIGFN